MAATKEQERKTLEQIKKIVDSLGEDSYIGTAFDGALLLAEQNIDDDAAYSARYYMDALSDTEDKLKEANEQIAELRTELENQNAIHSSEFEAMNKRLLSDYETAMLKKLLVEKTVELQKEVSNAASRIVSTAEEPSSAGFKNAVNDHRTAQQELDNYTNVLKSITAKGEAI